MPQPTPIDTELRGILYAAGVTDWTAAEFRRAREMLIDSHQRAHPRIFESRERWRQRAMRLRDRYEPLTDWTTHDRDPFS